MCGDIDTDEEMEKKKKGWVKNKEEIVKINR